MEFPAIVNLNVGGKIYTTTMETLTQDLNSKFTAMLKDRSVPVCKDSEGNFFIDRDGDMFRFVLNFLRTSELNLPKDFNDFHNLAADADFYQLPSLKKAVEKQEEAKNGVDFVHVTFQAHTKSKYRCQSGAHLWQKVVVVAPERILLDVFPDNGKAIQEKAIFAPSGLNLMAGYGFSGTGFLTIPAQYGRLQENVASLEFYSPDEYEQGFGVTSVIMHPMHLSADKYHICPDFHKYLLALFSRHGFELKGVVQGASTSNQTFPAEPNLNQKQLILLSNECVGPHAQNFEWYFTRK